MAKVLVVDDDPDVRDVLELLLGREHEVQTARGVPEAIALLSQGPTADVVVTDLEMGRHRGDELLTWLAIHHPEVRRILHTGTPRDRLDGTGALAHCVVAKSLDFRQLSEKIRDFFRLGSLLKEVCSAR